VAAKRVLCEARDEHSGRLRVPLRREPVFVKVAPPEYLAPRMDDGLDAGVSLIDDFATC